MAFIVGERFNGSRGTGNHCSTYTPDGRYICSMRIEGHPEVHVAIGGSICAVWNIEPGDDRFKNESL